MLLMLTLGSGSVWGQEGVWYIANDNTSSGHPGKVYSSASDTEKYYLVPAANPQQTSAIDAYYSPNHSATNGDPEKPFLATALTNKDLNSIWIVKESDESGYYFIIHALTGKYAIYEVPLPNDPNKNTDTEETKNGKRKTMHLQTIDNGDYNPSANDNFKFVITTSGGGYNIRPKRRSGWFWNPAGQNNDVYYGQASGEKNPDLYRNGLVGVYSNTGTNSIWHFEDASSATTLTPEISDVNGPDNTFTITSPAAAFSTIHYTTDGSTTPNATTGTTVISGSPITITGNWSVQAVGVFNSFCTPVAGPKGLEPAGCVTPVITYDYTTSNVSISCATPSSTIYYTTDGSTPTTSSTAYSAPFPVYAPTTVKAIATHAALPSSAVAELAIMQVATPTIQNNGSNAISITTTTPDATIYYTTDGSTPTTSSAEYTEPLTDNVSNVTIKAIAVKDGMITSAVGSGTVKLQCATPVITRNGMTFTLSCSMPTNANFYYTLGGGSEKLYSGPVAFTADQLPITVTAVARHSDYTESETASMVLKNGEGTPDDPYVIYGSTDFTNFVSNINSGASASASYKLESDVSASGIDAITTEFTGTFDGNGFTISGLSHPLFNTVNGGVVKNVMLKNVSISGSGNVGAIAGVAEGYTRIYNCGILPSNNKYENETSSVSSSDGYCGGIVGWLKDDSRVINCFSYANITGGTTVAGIVGYNNFASTTEVSDGKYSKLKTAVVNCMFYGNISGGTNRYPVYGGEKMLNNTATGINNYDFYRAEANLGLTDNNHYNCSWPAKEEYLTKYEYYRYLLNSNRELCGWWVGAPSAPSSMATTDVQDVEKNASLMAKWVLDPSIAPYPILKPAGKYYSAINQDPDKRINPVSKAWEGRLTSANTITTKAAPDTEGQKLGSITVTINKGGGLSGTDSKNIPITAMDIANNDFCYGKIQLPYYNSIFGDPNSSDWTTRYGGNYGDKVVIGWEITSVTGGTEGELVKNWKTGYNFADRDCTNKDKERIFAQGGYYYVPNGVSAITITAKWADAVYLDNSADHSYDRVYMSYNTNPNKYIGYHFAPAGSRPSSLGNDETVQTASVSSKIPDGSVYEKAIVLVGNHQYRTDGVNLGAATKGCTIISADFDLDDEPDYCLVWQLGTGTNRQDICPIRFDFLPVIEMGMAMKEDGSTQYYSLGCYLPLGHFEVTETSLMHFGQFEFGNKNRNIDAPLILNGGIYDQYCKGTRAKTTAEDHIDYVILGGNAYMPSFSPGAHVNDGAKYPTRHCAVNVIGGRVNNLYLTGNFNNNVTPNADDPHCYIDGGYFKHVAAAGKEGINGDVYFKINHSVINEFYGGSTLADKLVTGDIKVTIDNSKVTKYCGGPKFGDMTSGKTVTTNATGTTFGVYYGGGNGGTSYVQYDSSDKIVNDATVNYNWGADGKLNNYTPNTYRSTGKNYMADYEMEIVNTSTGTDTKKGIFRTYFYAAQFSATNTGPITNNLTNCKVLTSFYGGGNLGGVIGDVESTLTDTEVMGSAFGAGYSASVPEVTIYNKDKTAPTLNVYTGIITPTPENSGTSTTYTWTNETSLGGQTLSTSNPAVTNVDGKNYFYTKEPLENLGTVKGKVTLKIVGTTTVGGSVYGGGEESGVDGNTIVTVTGGTIGTPGLGGAEYGNVYGGGKGKEKNVTAGLVKGNTTVTISGSPTILHNVYGGGAYGSVGEFDYDTNGIPNARKAETTGGNASVTITGGTIGTTGKENGMVFGSSRGDVATPEGEPAVDPNDRMAWVYSTHVTIGDAGAATSPDIRGSIYGSGENGHTFQNTVIDINKGVIGITDTGIDGGAAYAYRGNVYGGGCGTDKYDSNSDGIQDKYNPLAGIVQGTTTINIAGGQVVHNVYGAGAMGSVGGGADANSGKTTINVTGGRIGYDGDGNGHIFGAARGEFGVSTAASGLANVRETSVNINYATTPAADNADKNVQLIAGSVFGGGEAGTVKESVAVNMTGGLILKDLYGGGALADTQTSNWDATANENAGGWADAEKKSALHTTTVRLTGGRVGEEVFGGGLGEAGKPAYVWGDVLVDLNGTTPIDGTTHKPSTTGAVTTNTTGCVVGQIFGCNNVNGTPKGDVMVHVYATQNAAATQIANAGEVTNAKVKGRYDVTAVYGGGNLAAYEPEGGKNTTKSTKVIIDGCGLTSIRQVYGGGNAASTPATNVTVNGTYEILELFGGGNGKDDIVINNETKPNPGANVGFYDYSAVESTYDTKDKRQTEDFVNNYVYGTGQASINVFGGTIHRVFGGSNTKGNVRQTAVTLLDENSGCDFCVDEAYGGGKSAPMDAEAQLHMACIPGLSAAYGGAEAAAIQGNVTLNITNGTFNRVFGGNNLSGTINGSITVNIEETGCKPIKIGELYGGGNQAGYSVYGYDSDDNPIESGTTPIYNDPQVNIKSFTSIGDVYGGGLGSGATMVGNPTVNVNVTNGKYYNDDVSVVGENAKTPGDYPIPSHAKGKMGAINNVFGGGNAAKVIGNTNVNIGTQSTVDYVSKGSNETEAQTGLTVLGADIRGNVYGGGNNAEVTGNTNVTIGKPEP